MKRKLFVTLATITLSVALGSVSFLNPNHIDDVKAYSPGTTYQVTTPEVYYSAFSSEKTGTDFLTDLRDFNMKKRKSAVGYSSMGTSGSGAYSYTDYDPSSVKYDTNGQPYGTSILSFYSGKSTTSFTREHVWPNSRGGGADKGKSGAPYVDQDIFMPRPTVKEENSDRGNSAYVEGMAHSSNGWDPVTAFEKTIGVYENIRGECARIIFYCMTVNPNLKLVDDANTDFAGEGGRVTMGKLSDLLKWNLNYSVNDRENNRNNGGQYLQGNRNAFVDHPEYACKIWGNYNEQTKKICGAQPEPPAAKTPVSLEVTTYGKTNYYSGETFDSTGYVITATYNDNSTQDVTSSVNWSPTSLTPSTKVVTGSYTSNGATVTVEVNVNVSDIQLVEIEITKIPNKVVYNVGESFSSAGLTVEAHFNNGTERVIPNNELTISTPSTDAGEKTIDVSYTYNGVKKSTSFKVIYQLSGVSISNIEITKYPEKREYFVDQELLLTGLEVTGHYSDGSQKDVTKMCTVTGSTSSVGTKNVSVSYPGAISANFEITVKDGSPTSQDLATDYSIEFNDVIKNVDNPSEVKKDDWQSAEYRFNKLSTDTKELFRTITYEQGKNEVSAGSEDKIIELVKAYDAVIIARKADGFNDFMNRNPAVVTDEKELTLIAKIFDFINKHWLLLVIGLASLIFLIILLVIIIKVSKKKKRKNKKEDVTN